MRTHFSVATIAFGLFCFAQPMAPTVAQAQMAPPNPNIKIVYEPGANDLNKLAQQILMENQVLEKLQRFLSPLKLKQNQNLTIRAANCDGFFYVPYRSGDPATICYEFVYLLERKAPPPGLVGTIGPAVVTHDMAVVGPFVQEALHNVSLALFDVLEIPVWGNPEFAADNVAAFLTLQFGASLASQLTLGSAYFLNELHKDTSYTLAYFGDIRPTFRQRYYNMLCIVSGSDPLSFSSFSSLDRTAKVTDLPKEMINQCIYDYAKLKHAFEEVVVKPYVDSELAKQVLAAPW
jgi:hypothetical protein